MGLMASPGHTGHNSHTQLRVSPALCPPPLPGRVPRSKGLRYRLASHGEDPKIAGTMHRHEAFYFRTRAAGGVTAPRGSASGISRALISFGQKSCAAVDLHLVPAHERASDPASYSWFAAPVRVYEPPRSLPLYHHWRDRRRWLPLHRPVRGRAMKRSAL